MTKPKKKFNNGDEFIQWAMEMKTKYRGKRMELNSLDAQVALLHRAKLLTDNQYDKYSKHS